MPRSDLDNVIHFRLHDNATPDDPITEDEILCWKVTGIKPDKDPIYKLIWNSPTKEMISCQECLELIHA